MLKGVLIGSAAALVVGGAIGAASVATRPPPLPERLRPQPKPADRQFEITLTNPREPASAPGSKLETLPPGTQDFEVPAPRAEPPSVRPPPEAREEDFARREPEPDRRLRDFADEDDPPAIFVPRPDDAYADAGPRWRDGRYERRLPEPYDEPEPYYPEEIPYPWRGR